MIGGQGGVGLGGTDEITQNVIAAHHQIGHVRGHFHLARAQMVERGFKHMSEMNQRLEREGASAPLMEWTQRKTAFKSSSLPVPSCKRAMVSSAVANSSAHSSK